MTTTADVMAEFLKNKGVDRIFGIPGAGSSTSLMEAAEAVGIETILTGHETSAAIIASVYGEIKGTPGVCFSIPGPGATNMTTGVAYAYLERAPLLAITERQSFRNYEGIYTQRIDQATLYKPITKANFTITSESTQEIMTKAFKLASEERPGPVHLDFPKDEADREATFRSTGFTEQIRLSHQEPKALDEIGPLLKRVERSKMPVLISGIESKRSGAHAELTAFAEKLGCPVMVSAKSRGSFDESHPLYAGIFLGSFSKGTFEDDVISSSDLLILVGLDPVELLPRPWSLDMPIIHMGPCADVDCIYSAEIEVVGDIRTLLNTLIHAELSQKAWDPATLEGYRNNIRESLSISEDALPLHHIIQCTRDHLPSDGVLCTDIGAFNSMVQYLWQVRQPNTYFATKGLSTMAFALPAAIGAKLSLPDRRVVCFIGDGSLLMCLHDLSLCSRLDMPIIIVVFSDEALGLIKIKQKQKGMLPVGIDLKNPDLPALMEAFGGKGFRVTTATEFDQAMEASIANGGLCLIEAVLNPKTYGDHLKLIRG